LKAVGCGAEPIQPETLRKFVERFSAKGLKAESLLPCYGLAEATLAVTFASLPDPMRTETLDAAAMHRGNATLTDGAPGLEIVSCGRTFPGFELAIRDGEGVRLPDRQVGEVWVRGPSVTEGYFGLAEETQEVLDRGWLRTGDLGFTHAGELFVSGRLKDLLIVRGRNYFPQDVEASVEAADARVRPGCVAAFQARLPPAGKGQQQEGVVVAVELRDAALLPPEAQALAAALRAAVLGDHGLALTAVLLLHPRASQKTTSGKIARAWSARAFAALVGMGGPGSVATAAASNAPAVSPPWVTTGARANVVLLWLAPISVEEAGEEAGEGPATNSVPASASAVTAPSAPAADPRMLTLLGAELTSRLLAEAAALLKEPLPPSEARVALSLLGLDSLLLAQLSGLLQAEYGFRQLRDDMLFAEYCSVAWLVAHAEALRGSEPLPEAALVPLSGVEAPPTPQGPAADAATASAPAEGPPAGGVAEVGAMPARHARHQATWCERHMPCCMICC
jgi:acyl carrier protein